jgi:hypothetical protein
MLVSIVDTLFICSLRDADEEERDARDEEEEDDVLSEDDEEDTLEDELDIANDDGGIKSALVLKLTFLVLASVAG